MMPEPTTIADRNHDHVHVWRMPNGTVRTIHIRTGAMPMTLVAVCAEVHSDIDPNIAQITTRCGKECHCDNQTR